MKTLSVDAEQHPVENILLILLLFFSMVFMPTEGIFSLLFGDGNYVFSAIIVNRVLYSIAFVVFILLFGFKKLFYNFSKKGAIVGLIALLITISNFPFYSALLGNVAFSDSFTKNLFAYIISVFSIAMAEEFAFRGIIFILLIKILKDKKHFVILSVFASSLIFALSHFVNAITSPIGVVTLQVLYSLFTGAVFTFALILTKNIFVPVLLHFVFNFGGLLTEKQFGLTIGNIGLNDYFITILVGTILGCVLLYFLFKTKKEDLLDLV
jgi:membrane protease YdiL (CAAX protease family)